MKRLILIALILFLSMTAHTANGYLMQTPCGVKPAKVKPVRAGCRDMVLECVCEGDDGQGECHWAWVCVP